MPTPKDRLAARSRESKLHAVPKSNLLVIRSGSNQPLSNKFQTNIGNQMKLILCPVTHMEWLGHSTDLQLGNPRSFIVCSSIESSRSAAIGAACLRWVATPKLSGDLMDDTLYDICAITFFLSGIPIVFFHQDAQTLNWSTMVKDQPTVKAVGFQSIGN